MNSLDTSSLNSQHDVNFPVPIAQDPEFHITFLLMYLKKLWMKHQATGNDLFRCTCSESPCSILVFLSALGISKKENIRSLSRLMDYYLTDTKKNLEKLTRLSGPTKKVLKSRKNSKRGKTS